MAFTSVGRGVEGHQQVFFSKELTPLKSPENVMYERNSTIISVSWDPLTLFEARGFPIYIVTLIPLSLVDSQRTNRQTDYDNGIISDTTNESDIVIKGLDPNVEYFLTVAVRTSAGQNTTKAS